MTATLVVAVIGAGIVVGWFILTLAESLSDDDWSDDDLA